MTAWTPDELTRIGDADELQIASRRTDGSLRRFVTIWAVRDADAIYVRSAYGPENGWYRHARSSSGGRVRAGGVERDVDFEVPEREVAASISVAYHAKYDRYGARMVGTVVSDEAERSTLRLVPR
jgi:hypothetical protein